MRVFITGGKGQLGSAIAARLGLERVGTCDLPDCDVARADQIGQAIAAARPDVVIHCAALTDVDGCARDPVLAYHVNGLGTQNVALACADAGAALVYLSTNEVFGGEKREPYWEFDAPRPINAYGLSKLAGEWFASHLLTRFYIVRSSWLYAPGGGNFIHKIKRLADDQGRLSVVADEVSSPTSVGDLAEAIVKLIRTNRFGIYHLTNAGCCSRYDWARKVLDLTGRGAIPIEPITRADFARPSTPPAHTVLANTCAAALGITLRPWEEALEAFLSVKYRVSSAT